MAYAKIHALIGKQMIHEWIHPDAEFDLQEDVLAHPHVKEIVHAGGRGYVELRSEIDGDMVLEKRRFPRRAA